MDLGEDLGGGGPSAASSVASSSVGKVDIRDGSVFVEGQVQIGSELLGFQRGSSINISDGGQLEVSSDIKLAGVRHAPGFLNILADGLVTADSVTGNGSVSVEGNNSRLILDGSLTSNVRVGPGGLVTASTIGASPFSSSGLYGQPVQVSKVLNGGSIRTGSVLGALSVIAGNLVVDRGVAENDLSIRSEATWTLQNGAHGKSNAPLEIGGKDSLRLAVANVTSGSQLTKPQVIVAQNGNLVLDGSGSRLTAQASVTIQGARSLLQINHGAVASASNVDISDGGLIELNDAGSRMTVLQSVSVVGSGTLALNGGVVAADSVAIDGGTLSGAGDVVSSINILNNGQVAPNAGVLRTGSITFQNGAKYVGRLNGLTAGSSYSQLDVAGTVNLGPSGFSVGLL